MKTEWWCELDDEQPGMVVMIARRGDVSTSWMFRTAWYDQMHVRFAVACITSKLDAFEETERLFLCGQPDKVDAAGLFSSYCIWTQAKQCINQQMAEYARFKVLPATQERAAHQKTTKGAGPRDKWGRL